MEIRGDITVYRAERFTVMLVCSVNPSHECWEQPVLALTCSGCGGTNLANVRDEKDLILHVKDGIVRAPIPLPLLCLDCGGCSHEYRPVQS
jgi:hypothetical protein